MSDLEHSFFMRSWTDVYMRIFRFSRIRTDIDYLLADSDGKYPSGANSTLKLNLNSDY